MALVTRSSLRVSTARASAPRVSVRPLTRVIARSQPEKATVNNVETAIQDAEKACQDGTAGECAAAWDNVEEISAHNAHKKVAEADSSDPLEKFCDDNPDADECRIYDD